MPNISNASAYIPGVCNINREEIAARRKAGYIGLSASVVVLALSFMLTDIRWWRVLVALPAFIAAIGFLQAKNKFCVGYGASGRQNAEPGSTQAHTVTSADALLKDKRRVQIMNMQAVVLALIITAMALLLP